MQKIIPHLWYDKEAKLATELYVSAIAGSRITSLTTLENTPSGSTEILSFELAGQPFQAISAGPYFKLNPSISFHIKCQTKGEVDAIWEKLSPGGQVLMELGTYPFSERYGWVQDKFGLSWQVIYAGESQFKQKIVPVMLFVGSVCGRTEEAVNYWSSIFDKSSIMQLQRYGKGEDPEKEGTVRYTAFTLAGQEFGAMDSAREHAFGFNEAISFLVNCDTQQEIDHYWNKLSAVPEAEQCGWLKDKFGISWQIVPKTMGNLLSGDDPERIQRVTQAFLAMKKLDMVKLQEEYDGK
jgi:predicted 3-demethylubiquinone-9 3-methyltransferase (glyoxalase superfamily)